MKRWSRVWVWGLVAVGLVYRGQVRAIGAEGNGVSVSGRVVDGKGKGAAGVAVALVEIRYFHGGTKSETSILGRATTDGEGNFKVSGTVEGVRDQLRLSVVAYGKPGELAWGTIDPWAKSAQATLAFVEGKLVVLRAVDGEGKAAAGVKVVLRWIGRNESADKNPNDWVGVGLPEEIGQAVTGDGVTDEKGEMTLRGAASGDMVKLGCSDQRFAPEATREGEIASDVVKLELAEPKKVKGMVARADGTAVADAIVSVTSWHGGMGEGFFFAGTVSGKTDAKGEFSVVPYHGEYFDVSVFSPANGNFQLIHWEEAKQVMSGDVTLTLPKGVIIRGTVVEEGSKKPIAGAKVFFESERNSAEREIRIEAVSDEKGHFVLTASPGGGVLLVRSPTQDYVKQQTTSGEAVFRHDHPSGVHLHPEAFLQVDLGENEKEKEVTIQLRRGITVHGKAIEPDGTAAAKGKVITTTYTPTDINFSQGQDLEIRDREFEIPGLEAGKEYTVWVVDAEKQCGATVTFTAQEGQEIEARLEACGTAAVRILDEEGKPKAGCLLRDQPGVHVVLMESPGEALQPFYDGDRLEAQMYWMDNGNYEQYAILKTDGDGQVVFPTLIPGAEYQLIALNQKKSEEVKARFKVGAGENAVVGEVRVEK